MNPVLPSIIRGPAIVIFNGYSYYTQGDIKVSHKRTTQPTNSDMWGNLGDTMESLVTDISFTPVGEIESMVKYYPYGPSSLVAASSVGNSIFTGSSVPVVIHTKAGQTITYHRAGISKMSPMKLSPKSTIYGEMTITALGKRTTQPSDAAALKTIASASFTDTGFDASLVIKGIYAAALGARSTPFDNIGARDGFSFEPMVEVEEVKDDNVGVADMIIKNVGCKVSFAPNNLTEAQLDELMRYQDSDVFIPGDFIGRGPSNSPEDLIIQSSYFTATLHSAGPVGSENGFGVSVDRNGNVEFTYKQGFTTGAPDPIFTLTIND